MITVEYLREIKACEEGILVFTEVYPAGLDPAAWTLEEQLRVLKHTKLREYLGWAWENQVVPQWSMTRADLTGADLTRAYLIGANLTGTILSGAILSGAILSGVDLNRANLRGADLTGADLCQANLYLADLRGADLRGAIWDEHEPPAGWRVNEDGRLEKQ